MADTVNCLAWVAIGFVLGWGGAFIGFIALNRNQRIKIGLATIVTEALIVLVNWKG
jgi:hypothetical protein